MFFFLKHELRVNNVSTITTRDNTYQFELDSVQLVSEKILCSLGNHS